MNSFFNTYKKLADKIIPVMTNNNFVKTGMLTPDEFVEAGDYLVKNFTNWKWSKISKNKSLSFLPPDKQMLKMRKTYGKKQIFVETIDTNSSEYNNRFLHKILVKFNIPSIYSSNERQFKWVKNLDYLEGTDSFRPRQ